jgi:hypothetical protein
MNIREFTPGIVLHDQLNPLLWDGDQLRPTVALALEHIAYKFEQFIGFAIELEDLIITGSQTAYTYTPASDIDLHLIVDFTKIACDEPVKDLFDTKRKLWKELHDINIHDVPVECYVEDLAEPVTGPAYSLISRRWIRKSRPVELEDLPDDVVKATAEWTQRIGSALRSKRLDQILQIRQALRDYRQQGLRQQGELATANLVFKTLRNNGAIGALVAAATSLVDRDMSMP